MRLRNHGNNTVSVYTECSTYFWYYDSLVAGICTRYDDKGNIEKCRFVTASYEDSNATKRHVAKFFGLRSITEVRKLVESGDILILDERKLHMEDKRQC